MQNDEDQIDFFIISGQADDDFLASACGDEKYEFAAVRVLKVKLASFAKLDKNHFEQI